MPCPNCSLLVLPLDMKCPLLVVEPQGRGLENLPLVIGTPLATSSAANQRYYSDKQFQLTLLHSQPLTTNIITVTHLITAGQTEQIDLLISTLSVSVLHRLFNVTLVLSKETSALHWKHYNMSREVFFKLIIRDTGITNITHYSHSDGFNACFDGVVNSDFPETLRLNDIFFCYRIRIRYKK